VIPNINILYSTDKFKITEITELWFIQHAI